MMRSGVQLAQASAGTAAVEDAFAGHAWPDGSSDAVEAGPRSVGVEWTETTRLMCAAAYTVHGFPQQVVKQLVEEELRAVRVPPGVDAEPVVRHCVAALRQKTLRDRLLALDVLIAGLVVAFASAGPTFAPIGPLAIAAGLLVAWIVVFGHRRVATRVVTRRLNAAVFDPADAPVIKGSRLSRRVARLVASQRGNLTVHSGFWPFTGSGADLGGWSFVIDLRKGKEEAGERMAPKRVEAVDLYEGVQSALAALELGKLTIEDRCFVNGTDLRGDDALLPSPTGRPTDRVSDAAMEQLIGAPTHRIRHYKCIRVIDWRGELVLSLFLRFSAANGRLFCELSKFVLAPLNHTMHLSDGILPKPEAQDIAQMAQLSLFSVPFLCVRAPFAVLAPLGRDLHRDEARKRARRDVFFDYGAVDTILDNVRVLNYTRYFQLLDKELYVKLLERTILDTILDVLDSHDVDTTDLVERRSTIINNGIMVPNGTVKAENLAVGAGAKIASRITGATKAASE